MHGDGGTSIIFFLGGGRRARNNGGGQKVKKKCCFKTEKHQIRGGTHILRQKGMCRSNESMGPIFYQKNP